VTLQALPDHVSILPPIGGPCQYPLRATRRC
jgi:hypothetical protein